MHATRRTRQSGVELAGLPLGEPLPVASGDVIGGKYRVTKIIGVGGMGVVAAAEHEELGQHVALKIMRSARKTPETVERFLREARAAVRLKSSHVAKVRDVGTLDNGLPYIVMDLLDGQDLFSVIRSRGPVSVEEAVDYILQACDAIAEAHSLGIVHRDIKPENLFLTTRRDGTPHVQVLDFGISMIGAVEGKEDGTVKRVTHESAIIGSPSYMSPEQIRSAKNVDLRTDIWALGCTLFELLTGQEAFGADNAPDIFVKVLEKPPPPLSLMRPGLPEGLEAVVTKCLEKDRDRRYESIDAFANALLRFSPSRSGSMPPSWRDYIQVDVDYDALRPAPLPRDVTTAGFAPPSRRKTGARTVAIPGRGKSRRRKRLAVAIAIASLFGVAGLSAWGARAGIAAKLVAPLAAALSRPARPARPAPITEVADPVSATTATLSPAAAATPSAPTHVEPAAAPADVAPIASAAASSPPPAVKAAPKRGRAGSRPAPSTEPPPSAAAEPTQHHRTDW